MGFDQFVTIHFSCTVCIVQAAPCEIDTCEKVVHTMLFLLSVFACTMRKRRANQITDSDDESEHIDLCSDEDEAECIDSCSDEDQDGSFIDDSSVHDGESDGNEEDEEGESSDSESEEETGYLKKEDMKKAYERDMLRKERPGYVEAPEHETHEDADTTWKRVVDTLDDDGQKKFGLKASENGSYRLIQRVGYGTDNHKNKWSSSGDYKGIMVPLIELFFNQKAYQPHPVGKTLPAFAFRGWKVVLTGVTDGRLSEWNNVSNEQWCLCCQNYWKTNSSKTQPGLVHVQIVQHEKSGIYVKTGGNCAASMLGLPSMKDAEETCPRCHPVDSEKLFLAIQGVNIP